MRSLKPYLFDDAEISVIVYDDEDDTKEISHLKIHNIHITIFYLFINLKMQS